MTELDIHAIGSTVRLDGTVSARVIGVTIRGSSLGWAAYYEPVWWNDRERKEISGVESWEIQSDSDESQKLMINQIL